MAAKVKIYDAYPGPHNHRAQGFNVVLLNPSPQPPSPHAYLPLWLPLLWAAFPQAQSTEYPPPSHCPPRPTPHFIPSPPLGIFLPEVMSAVHSLSSWMIFMNTEQGLCQVGGPTAEGQSLSHPPRPSCPTPSPPPAQAALHRGELCQGLMEIQK